MLKKLSVEVNIIILIKINLYMDKIFYIYMYYNLFYLKKYNIEYLSFNTFYNNFNF